MALSTAVKWFDSTQAGMPVLNSTAGSLISILDACLVNGLNLVALDGITVSAGVATATRSAGLQFNDHQVITLSGASPSTWNGEFRVRNVSSTSVQFDAPAGETSPPSGTISAKLSPAGWLKAFSATNKAAYKSANPAATGCYLRVDESTASDSNRNALVRGYETLTDIDTGTGLFPTVAQTTLYWRKSTLTNSATARPWRVIADDRFLYFLSSTDGGQLYLGQSFGDLISHRPGDGYGAFINGGTALTPTGAGGANLGQFYAQGTTDGHYLARNASQSGGALQIRKFNPASMAGYDYIGRNALAEPWPSLMDGRLRALPTYILEPAAGQYGLRGALPGLFGTVENLAAAATGEVFDNAINLAGRRLVNWKINCLNNTGSVAEGSALFDHTGPWRS